MTDVIEREVKLKLTNKNIEQILEKLKSEGYTIDKEVERDIYLNGEYRDFRKTDEALRLRITNKGAELTYKGPKMSVRSKSREEITVGITDYETMLKILTKLGFNPVHEVQKIRYYIKINNFTICLDKVQDLGDFIEIEGINS
ncbi:class IV adenylate cyclase, partial [Acidianus sp. RZ1]